MSTDLLQEIVEIIAAAPHSATALTLYALVSTLEYESAGCLFKLTKLRDMDPRHRTLAYALMDLMAEGANKGQQWQQAKRRMDELVHGGSLEPVP